MIETEVAFSAALVVALVAAIAVVHRRLPPRLATRYIAGLLAALGILAVPTVALFGLAFVAHAPMLAEHLRWCSHHLEHHPELASWFAPAAGVWAPIALVRVVRVVRSHGRLRCVRVGPPVVTDDPEPFAATMPGPAGRIVLSRGLLARLDEREAAVVVAHERAHARHRHDRYLLLGELVVAIVPPLRWLAVRLAFSVERWADETAAAECHDRGLVARTIGKVALFGAPSPMGMAFAHHAVLDRIRSLLGPEPRAPDRNRRWTLRAGTAVTGVLVVHQVNVLVALLAVFCH